MGANIPPNGLFARHGGQFKAPANIYVRDATPSWDQAEFVWVSTGFETWELLWARTAGSPASVTATYQANPTQVTVSWVHANPKVAEQYRVYRPDGSLVGTVSSTATSLVDSNPRPLNGSYEVRGVVGGVPADTGTFSAALDLRLTPVGLAGSWGAGITLTWSLPALGAPDQWELLWNGVVIGTQAGTATSWFIGASYTAGAANTYAVRAVLSGVTSATSASVVVNVPANVPTGVTLTATTSPLSNLRLSWGHPTGSRTGYEVQRYVASTGPWTAHATLGASSTTSDWSTTVSGYMRVRTLSAGGPSDWVQVGPVEPINDITPPANAVVTSFRPEASYGRMVVRFTTPNDTDFSQYLVQHRFGTGGWSNLTGWVTANRNTAYAVVGNTISQGQDYRVRVLVRDLKLNQNTGPEYSYVLGPSQIVVNPSGDLSGTWRGSAWRNDSTRSTTEIATGWTSSGHNIGCYFYGTTIATALGSKTIVSATVEYWRENEGGLGAAVQPLFWTHALTGRTAQPAPNAHGVAEASRLGSGVARTGTTGGTFNLPSAFITALQSGAARGLCMYRGYQGSGDPDSYYALMSIGNVQGGSPSKRNGRITFNSLG